MNNNGAIRSSSSYSASTAYVTTDEPSHEKTSSDCKAEKNLPNSPLHSKPIRQLKTIEPYWGKISQVISGLNFKGQTGIQDQDLMYLIGFSQKLVDLDLEGCHRLTDQTIEFLISNCSNLKTLNLKGCTLITDQMLDHLLERPSLKKLVLPKISECLGLRYLSPEIFNQSNEYLLRGRLPSEDVEGESILYKRYIFHKKKKDGVELGFQAKKTWQDSDNYKLYCLKHKYCKQACEKLFQDLKTLEEKPSILAKIDYGIKSFQELPEDQKSNIINYIQSDVTVQKKLRAFLISNDCQKINKKFHKIHHIKFDYIKESPRESGWVKRPIKPEGSLKWIYKPFRISEVNLSAIKECLANDLMRILAGKTSTQNLKLIPSKYENDNDFPKLMLDGTHMQGLEEEESFYSFSQRFESTNENGKKLSFGNPKLIDGYPISDKDMLDKKVSKNYKTDDTIQSLGKFKIFMLLLADRDAIGSTGSNKGYLVDFNNKNPKKTFAIIDTGHCLDETLMQKNKDNGIFNDFSFSQPISASIKKAMTLGYMNLEYKNFSIFDDTPYLEKMEGVVQLEKVRKSNEDVAVFDAYASKFNESLHEELNFKKDIEKLKTLYIGRRDYILDEVFEKRLCLMYSEEGRLALNILDCLEKKTSEIKEDSFAGRVRLTYPRIVENTRIEWSVTFSTNTYYFEPTVNLSTNQKDKCVQYLQGIMLASLSGVRLTVDPLRIECEKSSLMDLNRKIDTFNQYANWKKTTLMFKNETSPINQSLINDKERRGQVFGDTATYQGISFKRKVLSDNGHCLFIGLSMGEQLIRGIDTAFLIEEGSINTRKAIINYMQQNQKDYNSIIYDYLISIMSDLQKEVEGEFVIQSISDKEEKTAAEEQFEKNRLIFGIPGDFKDKLKQNCKDDSTISSYIENSGIKEYLQYMQTTEMWGGAIEMQAASKLFGFSIVVYHQLDPERPPSTFDGSLGRTIYLENTGRHYNFLMHPDKP